MSVFNIDTKNVFSENKISVKFNGAEKHYGMVTVSNLNIDGGICDANFTMNDAQVVCR